MARVRSTRASTSRAIRERLATNGLFCQWLPLHQLDESTLRVVVRTFLEEFPQADAWLLRFNVNAPVLGLIGWKGGHRFNTNWIESRLADPRLAMEIKRLALADSVRVFGHLAAAADDLRHFAKSASPSTDDNPRVTFMAPRLTYQRYAKPYASLFALLDAAKQTPSALHFAEPSGEAEFARRVSNYITARNIYLRGLALDAEERRDDAIGAYVESARLSSEFTSGYAQCLTIASVIANSNPARAKSILEQLMEAQPERPVAKEMLERLFPK